MPRTFFFDLDGTITDSAPGITRCVAHALEVCGLPEVDEARLLACVGPPLFDSFRDLCSEADVAEDVAEDTVETLVSSYRERYVDVGMFENVVYAGIEALLPTLEGEGIALHVVTSKPSVYAELILEHFGLRAHFGIVQGSELDGSLASKPELIGEALRRVGSSAHETAMIGDRGVDMSAARGHGLAAWGVRWGYGSDDELRSAGAQIIAGEPGELLRLGHAR